jgi:outer membrane protein FlgP
MTIARPAPVAIAAALSIAVLSGCVESGPLDAVPADAAPATRAVAQLADDLESFDAAGHAPMTATGYQPVEIIGRGFSQVAGQPGGTVNERRLLAIRAARMEAMRDLTEQVHGIRISSASTLRDAAMTDDSISGIVDGEIRGARTVSITPRDADSFEVVLALDPDTVRYILRATKLGF